MCSASWFFETNRCYNNWAYLLHVQAKPRQAARETRSKLPPRCRLSNKQIIHLLLHPSPGAKRHGASRPLPSNGRLCISQKNSATPTRPSPSPSFRQPICMLQAASLSTSLSTELYFKQLGNFEGLRILCWNPHSFIDFWFISRYFIKCISYT